MSFIDVLLLFLQVAFRCFYTSVPNKNLYPTFSTASGRVGGRYTNIFKELVSTFQLREFILLTDERHQAKVHMTGLIQKTLDDAHADCKLRTINHVDDIRERLTKVKENNTETGLYLLNYNFHRYAYTVGGKN